MKIVCPQCRTSYDVTPAALGPDGRQVRCVRCQSVWFAEPPRFGANVIPLAAHDARAAPLAGLVRTEPAAPPPLPGDAPPAADIAPAPPEPTAAVAPVHDAPAVPEAVASATGAEAPTIVAAPDAAAPAFEQAAPEPSAGPPIVDIESVAARRTASPWPVKRPQRAGWRGRKPLAAAVALAVINTGLIVGRAEVVRVLPQTASLFEAIGLPVNLRELAFKDVKTTQETHDGVTILVIEGVIVATGREVTDVPRLRFAIGAANGHEIYAWTALPTRTKLAPGETLAFRTRLASPPEQGRSVKIRFFTRLDLASGLR